MNNRKELSVRSRAGSIKNAFTGLKQLILREPNAAIHLVATTTVIAAGIIAHLDIGRWLWLSIAIAMVWISEAFNTAIELLCDLYIGSKYNETVKTIKDVSAGAVLIASICSIAIAIFVFSSITI